MDARTGTAAVKPSHRSGVAPRNAKPRFNAQRRRNARHHERFRRFRTILARRPSAEATTRTSSKRLRTDFRSIVPRFTSENLQANQVLVDLLTQVARKKNATPAQIALAWILAQKPWIVPIPGTTKLHRLEENNGAAALVLTAAELNEIKSALERIKVAGERYPEELEKRTGL
jgi:aryl-alcohol dehydrogenase-like predicted oxidoreductase